MLFVIVIPTADYEQQVLYGVLAEEPSSGEFPDSAGKNIGNRPAALVTPTKGGKNPGSPRNRTPVVLRSGKVVAQDVPLEMLVEEILARLYINNAVWCLDKEKNYFQVWFMREIGDETENCLHALQEAGVGTKLNSIINVSPSSVYEVGDDPNQLEETVEEDRKAWTEFVESVRSKLTVAEVVDGVKASAELTFDYVLLILTADMIAAVSLVENDAVNVVAAMLVSPLMSCVVAMTFGAAISDRDLMWTGWRSAMVGIAISWIFGFVFGLLVGTTSHPWGYKGWPTFEMTVRGNPRSLWIGALWALPSGSGVALALLQGSAGPLIGVAISATLLPPIVNCGILWALTCMKIHYGDSMKIPHVAGESFNTTQISHYVPTFYKDLSYELVSLGAVSFCLFLVNFGCIFAAAMAVLKIKEIAAPYTSSVDLRRFWETDIKVARKFNRESFANKSRKDPSRKKSTDILPEAARKSNIPEESLGEALGAAMREAMETPTFRKIKRCSYGPRSDDIIGQLLSMNRRSSNMSKNDGNTNIGDPAVMEQLVQALLGQAQAPGKGQIQVPSTGTTPHQAFNRLRPLSRSMRGPSLRRRSSAFNQGNLSTIMERTSGKPDRPMSMSSRALGSPAVRNLLQSIGTNAPRRLETFEEESPRPSRFGRRGSESTALMR